MARENDLASGQTPPERRPNPFRTEMLILAVAALIIIAAFLFFVGGGDESILPVIPQQERMNPPSPNES
jgi:hypothetical protein